jgi:hypothetical protein
MKNTLRLALMTGHLKPKPLLRLARFSGLGSTVAPQLCEQALRLYYGSSFRIDLRTSQKFIWWP